MTRRDFMHAAAAATGPAPPPRPPTGFGKPFLMHVGTQHGDSDEVLRVLAAFGVTKICSRLPSRRLDENWSVDSLRRLRDRVESFGIELAMVPLPMSSSPIERAEYPNILLGKDPERDREIAEICQIIENCARAGIPAVKYNLTYLGVPRTEPTRGRGGARYSTFDRSRVPADAPLTAAGEVDEETYWERITYFLERVVPCAEANRVRLACHPQDPGFPRGTRFRGIQPVLGGVEGLKRFVEICPSPYHGLNFCQGTICEMLENPRVEILDVIRYFGTRKKIFNVHFRNIKGRVGHFQETFPDDGDVDMIECLRTYKEVAYDGMVMPDHVPRIEGDEGARQAFAFAFGYIQAAFQVVRAEG